MIDHPVLLKFTNESIRTTADLLAGLLTVPPAVLDAVVGQGLAAALGTTDAALLRAGPWEPGDYQAVAPQLIAGSGDNARAQLTNHDVIALLRVLVVVKGMIAANDQLGPLVRKLAVNPRAYLVG